MTELSTTIGLANLGNTCFLNVVLQALRFSPPLGEICLINDTIEKRKESNKKLLVDEFQTLMRDFWKANVPQGGKPTMMPRRFHGAFLRTIQEAGDDWHHFGQQSDAAETIQYILNGIHDAIYKNVVMRINGKARNQEEQGYIKAIDSWNSFFGKEYSPIVENYNGQTQTDVICESCNAVSTRYEPWLMLKVPLPGGPTPYNTTPDATLTDCFNLGFANDSLDDYQCDACKVKGKATIRNRISNFPPVIILTLKRFTNNMQKVSGKVAWDMNRLDLRSWAAFSAGDPFNKMYTPPIYETTAVIEQQGSFRGGHYRMYAKQNGIWNEYDDNDVRQVPGESVANCDAYVVFLTRTNMIDSMNTQFIKHIRSIRSKHEAAKEA